MVCGVTGKGKGVSVSFFTLFFLAAEERQKGGGREKVRTDAGCDL